MADVPHGAPPNAEDLARSRVDHIGVPLWLTADAWVTEMYARAAARGFDDVSRTDSDVLAFLPPQGLSISELGRRRGVSKQAMQEAVRGLTRRGIVRLEPDRDDRRAVRVVYTERGLGFVAAFQSVKREMQAEVAAALGDADLRRLETLLASVRAVFGPSVGDG